MDLLEQCKKLNAQGEYKKLIELVNSVDENERSAEVISELAKAYLSIGDSDHLEPCRLALELLEPLEDELGEDHFWNYRIATAYYYLDQEGRALSYYERALDALPGDEDTLANIEECRKILALPRFRSDFRKRTKQAWDAFMKVEANLREIMDSQDQRERAVEFVQMCSKALKIAISEASFELGKRNDKYELCLSADGSLTSLFPLVYFAKHAPKSVLEHWSIVVGRNPSPNCQMVSGDISITADDVHIKVNQSDNKQLLLDLYCPKLKEIFGSDEAKVWWALSVLIHQTIGEINAIAYVSGLNVLNEPLDAHQKLSDLPKIMNDLGLKVWTDAAECLENQYCTYQIEPKQEADGVLRSDVFIGTTLLPDLIDEYNDDESDCMDEYQQDGIVPGFIAFPIDSFEGENRAEEILQFRHELQSYIEENASLDAVTFIGGATGISNGYIDFIAWDLPEVLDAASDFFSKSELPWATFHTFRRDVESIGLWEDLSEAAVNAETNSLLSVADIATLESYVDDSRGYYGKMLSYLEDFVEKGVEEKKFTKRQAQQDLQLALWYGFACINIDEYRYYYQGVEWMKHSERNASGCGTWYYRYSCALMNCGRLEDALAYAEKGAEQESDYPWVWLQVGKLRSHFGNKEGALEAVAHGLELVPGDHEFITLKREIESGATLEQMLYHCINAEDDYKLLDGLDEGADAKLRSLSCVRLDPQGLERFFEIFGPKSEEYVANSPFTKFPVTVGDKSVDLIFQMNEAGMSKLKADWLKELKSSIDSGKWLSRDCSNGKKGMLNAVMIGLDYTITLVYGFEDGSGFFRVIVDTDGSEEENILWCQDGGAPEIYSEDEMKAVEAHIEKYFGPIDNVLHEIVSPDIHVDICLIKPTEERDYYTLVTMGMGAHKMDVPEEYAEYKLERAELVIALPKDWKLDNDSIHDENWYWPLRLLKSLARLPIVSECWLGNAHTIDHEDPYAPCTQLNGCMLVAPQDTDGDASCMNLPNGDDVNFYQVIPLYQEEMEYKIEHGVKALIDKMAKVSFVVKNNRRCCIDSSDDSISY